MKTIQYIRKNYILWFLWLLSLYPIILLGQESRVPIKILQVEHNIDLPSPSNPTPQKSRTSDSIIGMIRYEDQKVGSNLTVLLWVFDQLIGRVKTDEMGVFSFDIKKLQSLQRNMGPSILYYIEVLSPEDRSIIYYTTPQIKLFDVPSPSPLRLEIARPDLHPKQAKALPNRLSGQFLDAKNQQQIADLKIKIFAGDFSLEMVSDRFGSFSVDIPPEIETVRYSVIDPHGRYDGISDDILIFQSPTMMAKKLNPQGIVVVFESPNKDLSIKVGESLSIQIRSNFPEKILQMPLRLYKGTREVERFYLSEELFITKTFKTPGKYRFFILGPDSQTVWARSPQVTVQSTRLQSPGLSISQGTGLVGASVLYAFSRKEEALCLEKVPPIVSMQRYSQWENCSRIGSYKQGWAQTCGHLGFSLLLPIVLNQTGISIRKKRWVQIGTHGFLAAGHAGLGWYAKNQAILYQVNPANGLNNSIIYANGSRAFYETQANIMFINAALDLGILIFHLFNDRSQIFKPKTRGNPRSGFKDRCLFLPTPNRVHPLSFRLHYTF